MKIARKQSREKDSKCMIKRPHGVTKKMAHQASTLDSGQPMYRISRELSVERCATAVVLTSRPMARSTKAIGSSTRCTGMDERSLKMASYTSAIGETINLRVLVF